MTNAGPRTYAEVDGFITMLQVACEDQAINATLQHLLSQPDHVRRAAVLRLVEKLRADDAYPKLIEALACLLDDAVAERAYQMIYQCGRKGT